MKKYLFSWILLLGLYSIVYSQNEKIEHESQIKREEFPPHAIKQLEPIIKKSKDSKFYEEFDGEKYFYEFKAKYKGEYYSIKFTEKGNLVDIERLYEFEKLKSKQRERMLQYLNESYKKYRLERFQLQYNREIEEDGPEDDEDYMEDFLEMDLDDLIVNYEMEVEVLSEEGESFLIELLFDSAAKLIQERKVQRRDEDYILY